MTVGVDFSGKFVPSNSVGNAADIWEYYEVSKLSDMHMILLLIPRFQVLLVDISERG